MSAERTKAQQKQMQSWPLEQKIRSAQTRIIEWYQRWEGGVYVSFSGGKDSTVLLDLVRRIYPEVPAVFVDTGQEFPEIRSFVKTVPNVTWVKPAMRFDDVIDKYGYPVISKEVSGAIYYAQKGSSWAIQKMNGCNSDGKLNPHYESYKKYLPLVDCGIHIGNQCCRVMKKEPTKRYEQETGLKPILGTQAAESHLRTTAWIRNGCNAFEAARPVSAPLSFWTEQDVLQYLKLTGIPYCSIYGDIVEVKRRLHRKGSPWITELKCTGEPRTGCCFCGYGVHLEKEPNSYQRMAVTHPKLYDYCIRPKEENGLGFGHVWETLGIPYKPIQKEDDNS